MHFIFCGDVQNETLSKKCPYLELLWSAFSRIESECGKTLTIITPNTDTFYAMKLPITGILEPLYADNLTCVRLITTDFGRQFKICVELTLACAPLSILYVMPQSFV